MYYSHGMFAHHKFVLTLYSYTRIYLYVTASCRLNRLFKAKLVQSRQCPVLSDASMRLSLDSPLKITKSEGKSLKQIECFFCLIEVLFRSKFNVGHFLNRDFYLANLEKVILFPTLGSGNYNGGKRHDVIANHSPCCIPIFITLTAKIYMISKTNLLSTIFKLV